MKPNTFRAWALALLGAAVFSSASAQQSLVEEMPTSTSSYFEQDPGNTLLGKTGAPDLLSVLTGKAAQNEQTVELIDTRIEKTWLVLKLKVQPENQYFVEPSTLALVLKEGKLALNTKKDSREKQTGEFEARFELEELKEGPNELSLTYQGCTENGVCLPPKTLHAPFAAETGVSPGILAKAGAILMFGLLLGLSPCVLPIAPLVVSSLSQPTSSKSARTFKSLLFLSSMATVYAAMGVGASLAGQGLSTLIQTQAVQIVCGVFLIGMAWATYKGVYFALPIPTWLENKTAQFNAKAGQSNLNVALSGAMSAVVISPCVSAGLAGILAYVAEQGDPVGGAIWLAALCLGMGTPLVICSALAITRIKGSNWMGHAQKLSALLMLGLGIAIASGNQGLFEPVAAGLLAAYVAYCLAQFAKPQKWSSISVVAGMIAILLSSGYSLYSADKALNWRLFQSQKSAPNIPVLSTQEFLAQVGKTENTNPNQIRVYFITASWCATCQSLKASLINPERIQALLGEPSIELFFVDITNNQESDQNMLKQFKLFGPPALLLFEGQTLKGTLNGEMKESDIQALSLREPDQFRSGNE